MLSKRTGLLAALLLIINLPQASFGEDPADWKQYNYDNAGWRFNRAEHRLNAENVPQLEEKWRFPRRDSGEQIGIVHATPIVVNGFVYFGTVYSEQAFYKLTPSGKVAWQYPIPNVITAEENDPYVVYGKVKFSDGVSNAALVHEDRVYFGTFGGQVICLDRYTGAEIWRVKTKQKPFPSAHGANTVMSSPIMADGKLIVAGGGFEHSLAAISDYPCCSGRGFVAAFEPDSGDVCWVYDVGPEPEVFPEPVVMETVGGGEKQFVAGPSTSSVWCTPSFDPRTKTLFFGTDTHNAPRRPTEDDARLYNKYSCAIIAISAVDGSERWVRQLVANDVWNNTLPSYDSQTGDYKDQSIGDTPKLYFVKVDGRQRNVVGVGCKNGGFYVIDRATGEIISETPTYRGAPIPDMIASNRILALPSVIGGLQTGCAFDGERIYTNGIDWPGLGVSMSRNGVTYAPSGGRVTAIAPTALAEHWRHERPKVEYFNVGDGKTYDCGDPAASGIAIAGDVLFFTTTISGKLTALNKTNGTILKEFKLGPVWCGPSISRGRVYVGSGNNLFRAWDVDKEKEEGAEKSPGVFGMPLTVDGAVYSFGLPGEDQVSRLPETETRD